ncbi:hypothetical protein [Streptomyces ipomoeae]|uniref:hypothetical protein n=1 Tax=Streptomyces ipomoeae TaxID=103232 RepID=UPI0011473B24|nr:hypothetical protein [Streptomyces ipomoeae]TQE34635.1 hypothetical protein Sipo7851_17235 [Streptomyces ipomoeae]
MHDLIEIVENSADTPTASWLPKVVAPLLLAEMSVTDFMKRAAKDHHQEVVRTLVALNHEFPEPQPDSWGPPNPWAISDNKRTVGALISHTARTHGARSTPAIVVAMRRAEIAEHVDSYLQDIARVHSAFNIQNIVQDLRMATLRADADKVLQFVGSKRRTERISEVARRFHFSGQVDDAKKIWRGISVDDWYRIKTVIDEIADAQDGPEFVREILRGIPYGKHSEYANGIAKDGDSELAKKVLAAANEPPF